MGDIVIDEQKEQQLAAEQERLFNEAKEKFHQDFLVYQHAGTDLQLANVMNAKKLDAADKLIAAEKQYKQAYAQLAPFMGNLGLDKPLYECNLVELETLAKINKLALENGTIVKNTYGYTLAECSYKIIDLIKTVIQETTADLNQKIEREINLYLEALKAFEDNDGVLDNGSTVNKDWLIAKAAAMSDFVEVPSLDASYDQLLQLQAKYDTNLDQPNLQLLHRQQRTIRQFIAIRFPNHTPSAPVATADLTAEQLHSNYLLACDAILTMPQDSEFDHIELLTYEWSVALAAHLEKTTGTTSDADTYMAYEALKIAHTRMYDYDGNTKDLLCYPCTELNACIKKGEAEVFKHRKDAYISAAFAYGFYVIQANQFKIQLDPNVIQSYRDSLKLACFNLLLIIPKPPLDICVFEEFPYYVATAENVYTKTQTEKEKETKQEQSAQLLTAYQRVRLELDYLEKLAAAVKINADGSSLWAISALPDFDNAARALANVCAFVPSREGIYALEFLVKGCVAADAEQKPQMRFIWEALKLVHGDEAVAIMEAKILEANRLAAEQAEVQKKAAEIERLKGSYLDALAKLSNANQQQLANIDAATVKTAEIKVVNDAAAELNKLGVKAATWEQLQTVKSTAEFAGNLTQNHKQDLASLQLINLAAKAVHGENALQNYVAKHADAPINPANPEQSANRKLFYAQLGIALAGLGLIVAGICIAVATYGVGTPVALACINLGFNLGFAAVIPAIGFGTAMTGLCCLEWSHNRKATNNNRPAIEDNSSDAMPLLHQSRSSRHSNS